MSYDLDRFVSAQRRDYDIALAEIRSGRKRSHWMWYIFPQLKGLGYSSTAAFYGIDGVEEAREYLAHPILGVRLREISRALLELDCFDPYSIFGSPDDMKLRSSMTLFLHAGGDDVFRQVLEKYYSGVEDARTLAMLDIEA